MVNFHTEMTALFKNKEGLLPKQNAGHYTEFVYPTSGVNGAGLMRVVTGRDE